jgi:sugar phosphate isomerase/epimerase
MVYMHIRDQRADGKWTEAVGEGVINFPAIAKALKEINYKGKAAIELGRLEEKQGLCKKGFWMVIGMNRKRKNTIYAA